MQPLDPPAQPSRGKRISVIVWAVLVLVAMLCFFGAIAGPKFGSFYSHSASALAGDDDGGVP